MRTILLLAVLSIHLGCYSQNVRRGFRLLEKLDYERSTEIFQDAIVSEESIPAASFGLAMIYADDLSPYYNLVEAWEYVKVLEPSIDDLTQDEIEFIGEYFLNTEERRSNRPVKSKIEYAIAIIEAKLIKYIREENNLEIVYEVIERFPDFRHFDNVIHIRNQLEFRKYEKQHTLAAYREFIEKFPDAAQIVKAQRYISSLAFENTLQTNTVEAYQEYIHDYPASNEYNTAIRNLHALAFAQAKNINTMQAMDNFMTDYPDALEIAEAKQIQKQLLYEYAKKIQTLEAYNEFIRKYPEGQQYIDIFNLKSLDLGMKFISSNSLSSNNIQWTRSFEKEGYEGLNALIAENTNKEYILGGTLKNKDTQQHDIWILKVDVDGKMIWNRTIGELPDQDLRLLITNNADEIIGFGYTGLITDSINYKPWIFKLASDGQKLWSRDLVNLNALDMISLESGQILLGGFSATDSLESIYSVMLLSDIGKLLWSRNYTVQGTIHNLYELSNNHFLLSGDQWSAEIDPKGYIVWESEINSNDSITATAVLPSGDILHAGLRENKQLLVKTEKNSNKFFEKEYEVSGNLLSVTDLRTGSDGLATGICQYEDRIELQWFNTTNGNIEKTVKLPDAFRISTMLTDQQKNLLIVAADVQILLLKNFGTAF